MKPASSTIQDDIPPVHVLVAAEQQDRKETEDLLAGFDRPGRGPKVAPRERDFVDYYAKKPGGAGSGSGRAASDGALRAGAGEAMGAGAKARDVSTVIVRRKGDGAPAWLVWGGVATLMLLVGGGVAYLATADGRPAATAPAVPSAATTVTAATSPKPSAAEENIPPPSAVASSAEAVAVEAAPAVAPRGQAKRDPRAVTSGATTTTTMPAEATTAVTTPTPTPRATVTAGAPKASPREDFIRDL